MKKHIPNAITCCNLLCGVLAIVAAFQTGMLILSLLFVLMAAVFDFFDGFAARALKAYSPIGKELDSLADMVSFGVAPALVGYVYAYSFGEILAPKAVYPFVVVLPLFIAVFSALRLAKFNIDSRQSENFIGLATPACAILFISLTAYFSDTAMRISDSFEGENITVNVATLGWWYWIPIALVPILCFLLVCEIQMFSMKLKNFSFKDNRVRFIFLLIVIVEIAMAIIGNVHACLTIAVILGTYVVLNLIIFLKDYLHKRKLFVHLQSQNGSDSASG